MDTDIYFREIKTADKQNNILSNLWFLYFHHSNQEGWLTAVVNNKYV